MKLTFISGIVAILVTIPLISSAQTSIGFSTRNYALMPSETRQNLHIPITPIDVSYGLQINSENIYKELDLEIYTGVYLAQLGFFHDYPSLGVTPVQSANRGRREFIDLSIHFKREVFSFRQLQATVRLGVQWLIAPEETEYSGSSIFSQFDIITNTLTNSSIDYVTNRDPNNLFMSYGIDLSYSFKKIPFSLSSAFSYRDFIGDYFTQQTILQEVSNQIAVYNIYSSGNALEYSFSITYNF